jgi:putative hemolysin
VDSQAVSSDIPFLWKISGSLFFIWTNAFVSSCSIGLLAMPESTGIFAVVKSQYCCASGYRRHFSKNRGANGQKIICYPTVKGIGFS